MLHLDISSFQDLGKSIFAGFEQKGAGLMPLATWVSFRAQRNFGPL